MTLLTEALNDLGALRPCFHSEGDFQFALSWQIKTLRPDADVRLEIPVAVGTRSYKLDLHFRVDGKAVAVELKYYKAPLKVEVHDERFSLIDVVAHDLNRYDYLKDIQRLEHVRAAGAADEAYAVALTNQPKYWEPRRAGNRVDEELGIEEGRVLPGQLAWAEHVGGTSKGREEPICLAGAYELKWSDYSEIPGQRFGRFRYLAVPVVSGVVPEAPQPRGPRAIRESSRVLARDRYEKLGDLLAAKGGEVLKLTFAEIEHAAGPLPASARRHRPWWANHGANPQAIWIRSGWKVVSIDLAAATVVFEKAPGEDVGRSERSRA